MNIVKCRRCNCQIDKRVQEYVKLNTGYAHKDCEEKFQIKKNTVICQVCRQGINKLVDEYIKRSDGYVHCSCIGAEEKDKIELYNYITEIFSLKAPGPVNLALIKKFHTENGYSYKSMLYALKYYYEIRKGSIEKSQNRIGILPYVYEEAKKYYENLTQTQNTIANNIEKQKHKEEKTIIIKSSPKRKIKNIDLEELN